MISRLALLGVALLAAACASVSAPPPSPPPPRITTAHHTRALALEADGLLRPALLEWKIVRAIDPNDTDATAQQARLEARIASLVSERMAEARTALQRGAHLEARRKLLSVLALDPAYTPAADLLRTDVRDVEFVLHTVRAGETLSALAERYYGDRARGEVIWETNQLPPSRPLVAGAVLKIPEIPGVPFYTSGRKTPPPAPTVARPAPAPERPEKAPEEPPEVNPMLADAREAIDRKEYAAALEQVDHYLTQNPRDHEGLDLKKLVLYRHGRTLFEQKKYDDSYRALTQLARLQPDYPDVTRLLQQARRQAIDRHYQEGIRLFREEHLKEAIAEWRIVLEMEPQNQNARRNVEQAERMLQGLERRKSR